MESAQATMILTDQYFHNVKNKLENFRNFLKFNYYTTNHKNYHKLILKL